MRCRGHPHDGVGLTGEQPFDGGQRPALDQVQQGERPLAQGLGLAGTGVAVVRARGPDPQHTGLPIPDQGGEDGQDAQMTAGQTGLAGGAGEIGAVRGRCGRRLVVAGGQVGQRDGLQGLRDEGGRAGGPGERVGAGGEHTGAAVVAGQDGGAGHPDQHGRVVGPIREMCRLPQFREAGDLVAGDQAGQPGDMVDRDVDRRPFVATAVGEGVPGDLGVSAGPPGLGQGLTGEQHRVERRRQIVRGQLGGRVQQGVPGRVRGAAAQLDLAAQVPGPRPDRAAGPDLGEPAQQQSGLVRAAGEPGGPGGVDQRAGSAGQVGDLPQGGRRQQRWSVRRGLGQGGGQAGVRAGGRRRPGAAGRAAGGRAPSAPRRGRRGPRAGARATPRSRRSPAGRAA